MKSSGHAPQQSRSGRAKQTEEHVLRLNVEDVTRRRPLDREEEARLAIAYKTTGDKAAREALLLGHGRYVLRLASKYNHLGLDLADLMQEASIGLLDAIEVFDPSRGNRLLTYAKPYMQRRIFDALSNQSGTIWHPRRFTALLKRIVRAEDRLLTIGRNPTIAELAAEAGLSVKKTTRLLQLRKGATVHYLQRESPGGGTLEDRTPSDALISAGTVLIARNELARMQQLFDSIAAATEQLSEQDRLMILKRFGLDDGSLKPRSSLKIAETFSTTQRNVHARISLALRTIRKSLQLDTLTVEGLLNDLARFHVIKEALQSHPES